MFIRLQLWLRWQRRNNNRSRNLISGAVGIGHGNGRCENVTGGGIRWCSDPHRAGGGINHEVIVVRRVGGTRGHAGIPNLRQLGGTAGRDVAGNIVRGMLTRHVGLRSSDGGDGDNHFVGAAIGVGHGDLSSDDLARLGVGRHCVEQLTCFFRHAKGRVIHAEGRTCRDFILTGLVQHHVGARNTRGRLVTGAMGCGSIRRWRLYDHRQRRLIDGAVRISNRHGAGDHITWLCISRNACRDLTSGWVHHEVWIIGLEGRTFRQFLVPNQWHGNLAAGLSLRRGIRRIIERIGGNARHGHRSVNVVLSAIRIGHKHRNDVLAWSDLRSRLCGEFTILGNRNPVGGRGAELKNGLTRRRCLIRIQRRGNDDLLSRLNGGVTVVRVIDGIQRSGSNGEAIRNVIYGSIWIGHSYRAGNNGSRHRVLVHSDGELTGGGINHNRRILSRFGVLRACGHVNIAALNDGYGTAGNTRAICIGGRILIFIRRRRLGDGDHHVNGILGAVRVCDSHRDRVGAFCNAAGWGYGNRTIGVHRSPLRQVAGSVLRTIRQGLAGSIRGGGHRRSGARLNRGVSVIRIDGIRHWGSRDS